jgi:hypothetical protein
MNQDGILNLNIKQNASIDAGLAKPNFDMATDSRMSQDQSMASPDEVMKRNQTTAEDLDAYAKTAKFNRTIQDNKEEAKTARTKISKARKSEAVAHTPV